MLPTPAMFMKPIKFVTRKREKFYRSQIYWRGEVRILKKKFRRAAEAARYGDLVVFRLGKWESLNKESE